MGTATATTTTMGCMASDSKDSKDNLKDKNVWQGLPYEVCGEITVCTEEGHQGIVLADGSAPGQHGGVTFKDDLDNDGKVKIKFDFELGEKSEGICLQILDSKAEGHCDPGVWADGLGYDGRAGGVLAIAFQNGGFGSKRGICLKYKAEEQACVDKVSAKDICFEGHCCAKIKLEKEDNADSNKEELKISLDFENTRKTDAGGTSTQHVTLAFTIVGDTPDHLKISITGATGADADRVVIKDLKLKGDF